jgi:hypothetical protein
LSSIFIVKSGKGERGRQPGLGANYLSEIDVIDRANKAIFGINTRSGSAWNRQLPPCGKSRIVPEFLSGTAGKAGVDVSKDAVRTI